MGALKARGTELDRTEVELAYKVERVLNGRRWWLRTVEFQDLYSAACTYAAVARHRATESAGEGEDGPLVLMAVHRLEEAMRRTDSVVIGQYRDWILREDPDLDAIRGSEAFRHFEARYFSASQRSERPRDLKRAYEMTQGLRVAMGRTAVLMRGRWQDRWAHETATWTEAARWWQEEADVWNAILVAAKSRRHWPARLQLIEQLLTLSPNETMAARTPSFRQVVETRPRNMDGSLRLSQRRSEPKARQPDFNRRLAEHELDANDGLLDAITAVLDARDKRRYLSEWTESVQGQAAVGAHRRIPASVRRRMVQQQVGAWSRFLKAIDDVPELARTETEEPGDASPEEKTRERRKHFEELIEPESPLKGPDRWRLYRDRRQASHLGCQGPPGIGVPLLRQHLPTFLDEGRKRVALRPRRSML